MWLWAATPYGVGVKAACLTSAARTPPFHGRRVRFRAGLCHRRTELQGDENRLIDSYVL